MAFPGLWFLVVAVVETFFGVLKSKSANGLDFMFWSCLTVEFVCACVQFTALFAGEQDAFRADFRNRGVRVGTSSLSVAINGSLPVVEAVLIGRKLYAGSWLVLNSRRFIITFAVLFALLVATAIPILITGFLPPITNCCAMNRRYLDLLTMNVTTTPAICLVMGFIALRFVSELNATKRVALYMMVIFVAYICYSVPMLALGILLMRIPSDCDKHTVLLISNFIPAVVIWCSGLVFNVDRNPDSGYPEAADESIATRLNDASVLTPEQPDASGVSGRVSTH